MEMFSKMSSRIRKSSLISFRPTIIPPLLLVINIINLHLLKMLYTRYRKIKPRNFHLQLINNLSQVRRKLTLQKASTTTIKLQKSVTSLRIKKMMIFLMELMTFNSGDKDKKFSQVLRGISK